MTRQVEVELAEFKTLLKTHIANQEKVNAHLAKLCEQHNHFINGNGKPGAKVRLDRLEQRNRLINWFSGTAAAAMIMTVLRSVSEHWPFGS